MSRAWCTALALGLPFRAGPAELFDLVKKASETYPYTSLYAFNVWSIIGDFWKPDDRYVVYGVLLLVAGLLFSCALLWRRRDTATFLAAGAIAACAFYFLPTRAHERYLFPAFVLLLPLVATRVRLLWPYVVLSLAFTVSLYFAFTRYEQNDLKSPPWLETTLFSRNGQIALALLMLGTAGLIVWRLVRGEARLEPSRSAATPRAPVPAAPRGAWQLPAALARGRAPTRRDLSVALLVALAVLLTRGYRLDHPRDMYFDEVYHARTAFELLAQRDPYEWTHPHLAKEIMAVGILAFGDDRVVGREPLRPNVVAFAVGADGTRAFATSDGAIALSARGGAAPRDVVKGATGIRALLLDGDADPLGHRHRAVRDIRVTEPPSNFTIPRATLPMSGPVTSLIVSGGRVVVATASGIAIYTAIDAPPVVSRLGGPAVTANKEGTELYLLDPAGNVRVVDPATGTGDPAAAGRRARPRDRVCAGAEPGLRRSLRCPDARLLRAAERTAAVGAARERAHRRVHSPGPPLWSSSRARSSSTRSPIVASWSSRSTARRRSRRSRCRGRSSASTTTTTSCSSPARTAPSASRPAVTPSPGVCPASFWERSSPSSWSCSRAGCSPRQ